MKSDLVLFVVLLWTDISYQESTEELEDNDEQTNNYAYAEKLNAAATSSTENLDAIQEITNSKESVPGSIEKTKENSNGNQERTNSEESLYAREIAAGNQADLLGFGSHLSLPTSYADDDLGRRYFTYYRDTKKEPKVVRSDGNDYDKETNSFQIVKAPPEVVLAVAKQSALLEASKPINPTEELLKKDALRTGDYWNAVWKEDVNPSALRSVQKKTKTGTIKAKVLPGSKLYKLISVLQKVSPRLLYVIYNKKPEKYELITFTLPSKIDIQAQSQNNY